MHEVQRNTINYGLSGKRMQYHPHLIGHLSRRGEVNKRQIALQSGTDGETQRNTNAHKDRKTRNMCANTHTHTHHLEQNDASEVSK